MALTGVLKADFSDFQAAVSQAEVKLASFQAGADRAGPSLTRMANSFSGTKLISDATLMTEAVDRIGGASKLTATEMAAVNLKVGEAIEKFRALGQQAPAEMTKLHTETSKVSGANQSVLTTLAPLAGAFGIAFSVGSMVSFGKSILADADALVKLSDKTGIAIGPLQGLKFAAEQSGNSFEQVTSAISMMQRRIGDGDDSAVSALRRLGIALSDFKALTPDQQFVAIAREVAKIEDPMERVRVATELFGRSGAEVLATLISKIDELTNKAPKMAEGAVKAFDDIGDAANLVGGHIKTGIGNAFELAIDHVARFAEGVRHLSEGELARAAVALGGFNEQGLAKLPPAIDGANRSLKDMGLSMGEMDRISREMTKTTQEAITKNDALKRTQDALFGRDHIDRANQYVTALGGVENLTKLTDDKKKELKASVDKAIAAYEALGEKAPAALLKIVEATKPAAMTMAELDAEVTKLHSKSLPPFTGLLQNIDRSLDPLPASVEAFRSGLVFTAETIETIAEPALERLDEKVAATARTFSEAMALVQRGLGTMTGSFANPHQLSGSMSPAEQAARAKELGGVVRYDDYGNPYVHVAGQNLPGTPSYTPRRLAGGGAMQAGETAWVGERGPELFTPRSAGTITPGGAGGATQVTVHVHGSTFASKAELGALVEQALVDVYRARGGRL